MKNIYDLNHVKSVSAVALLKGGKYVGRIVANWSDNPNGSVCTAQVMLWDGEISDRVKKEKCNSEFLKDYEMPVVMIGRAGGYGYDKLSSAIASALSRGGISDLIKVEGGAGNQENAFKDAGFDWVSVI